MSQFIPSMNEWKSLPQQEDRRMILEQIRNEIGDKALCQTWDLTPNQYYSLLMRYKFSTKGIMKTLGAPPVSFKNKKKPGSEKKSKSQSEIVCEPVLGDRIEPLTPLIDVEYHHVDESNDVADNVQLPFPALRGSPSQLSKQFEALALFLEALDEDARYEVHISAVKL